MKHELRLIEAILFASANPVPTEALRERLPEECDVEALLSELCEHYAERGIAPRLVAGGWTFRTAEDLAAHLRLEKTVIRKPSRAAVETLAVIAYHQPITRSEVEEIRGVAASKGTFDVLLEAGWIRPAGRRRTPGRPTTWGTTPAFLEHFGLSSLADLPGVDDLKAAGLIDTRPASVIVGIGRPEDPPRNQTEEADDADADDGDGPVIHAASEIESEIDPGAIDPGTMVVDPESRPHLP